MTTLSPELMMWLMSLKGGAVITLFFWLLSLLVYTWLVKADPAAFLRDIKNSRQRRLEKIAGTNYLTPNSRKLATREIRQRHNRWLTGLDDHRLQDACTRLCVAYNLLGNYFAPWRAWLTENEGKIIFNWRMYRIMRILSVAGILTITAAYCLLMRVFVLRFGFENLAVFMVLNLALWWGPLLFAMSVPGIKMTHKMVTYTENFNRSVAQKIDGSVNASGTQRSAQNSHQ